MISRLVPRVVIADVKTPGAVGLVEHAESIHRVTRFAGLIKELSPLQFAVEGCIQLVFGIVRKVLMNDQLGILSVKFSFPTVDGQRSDLVVVDKIKPQLVCIPL